jgi:hypothetical protein
MLDEDIPICPDIKINTYETYKKNFKPREAVSICRGFNLCAVHTRTIKKDNKIRITMGKDIPKSLEIVKKMVRSDI